MSFIVFSLDAGLDIPKHGEPAYPFASYGDGWSGSTFIYLDPRQKPSNVIGEINETLPKNGVITNHAADTAL